MMPDVMIARCMRSLVSYLSHVAHQAKPWDEQHVVGKTIYSMSVVAHGFAGAYNISQKQKRVLLSPGVSGFRFAL